MYVAVNWVIIGPTNGLWPVRRQAITPRNTGSFSIELLVLNFSEIWIKMQIKKRSFH